MGWTSSGDMRQQLRLRFDSKEEAVAYAERHGIPYQVSEAKPPARRAIVLCGQFRLQAPRPLDALTGATLSAARPSARCAAAGIGLALAGARWRNSEMKRSSGIGWPSRKPWPIVAAHADQRERVGGLLDADGDGEAAEIVREVDDGLAQRRVDLVGAAVGDEGAVELELGKRQFLEPDKRRIAPAEIVDRKLAR